MQFYKIAISNLIFYAKVETIKRDKRTIIQFGSAKFKDCLSIHVFENSKIAELHGLMYNQTCSINMPLPKNEGTVSMVKAGLKFAVQLFPHITQFELTDVSQVRCGKHNMSLSDFYFATRGKTWYENRFGAQPSFTNYGYLRNIFESKPILDFDDLWEKYLQYGHPLYKKDKQYYQYMYDRASSWFDFLNRWFEEEGCKPFMYLSDTPVGIIGVVNEKIQSLHGKVWEIAKATVETYDTIKYNKITATEFPNIQWHENTPPKHRGGRMILPMEVMDDV